MDRIGAVRRGHTVDLIVDEETVGHCGFQRLVRGVSRLAIHEIILGPWRADPGNDLPSLLRAALRLVTIREAPWHHLTILEEGLGPVGFDVIWRYSVRLGWACEIVPGKATIWSEGAKGMVARTLAPQYTRVQSGEPFSGRRYSRLELRTMDTHHAPLPLEVLSESELSTAPYALGLTPRAIEAAIHRGDTCYAVKENGQVCYSIWLSSESDFLSSLLPSSLLAGRVCYAYGALTVPAYRRQGLHGRALMTLAALAREWYDYMLLRTNPENIASIRVSSKAGFKEMRDADEQGS